MPSYLLIGRRTELTTISRTDELELLSNDPHPYKVEILAAANQSREIVTVSPTLPPPLEQTSFTWVESTSQLREMLEKLKSATAIAVDLEHHDRRTYRGIVCLMQISTRNQDFIVDTLALHDELEVLNDVFADPSILKVFHGAESDIKWLQRDFNLYVVNLFDTYHASVELSELPQDTKCRALYNDTQQTLRGNLWRIYCPRTVNSMLTNDIKRPTGG